MRCSVFKTFNITSNNVYFIVSWPVEVGRGQGKFPPLFGKQKEKKCIIIAWCYYTNVHLTVFWALIHQKCAPNCPKLIHKIKNFSTYDRGTSPLRHPLLPLCGSLSSALHTKLSPPLFKLFRGPWVLLNKSDIYIVIPVVLIRIK